MKLKTVTVDDVLSWRPCCTTARVHRIMEGRKHWNALHFLDLDIPPEDIFWVIPRRELVPERTLHMLSCDYAESVLHIWEARYPDDFRPHTAIDVKRAWVRGDVDGETRTKVWEAAWAAAGEAVMTARAAARAARAAGGANAAVGAAWAAGEAVMTARAAAWEAWAAGGANAAVGAVWAAGEAARKAKLRELLEWTRYVIENGIHDHD